MKKLFAGFWVGEFGWELMTWIPHVRAVAKNYDHVIVGCKPGHEPLYEFADEFVNFDYTGANCEQWFNKGYDHEAFKKAHYFDARYDILTPQKAYSYSMKTHKEWLTGLEPREFKGYGEEKVSCFDVVINVRNRKEHDSSFRNWDAKHAEEFTKRCFKELKTHNVACIGTTEQSLYVPYTNDLRGWDQEIINKTLRNAKVFVSSINGATHLASLCGCPQVSWVTKAEHKERLETTWNPFKTPTKIFSAPGGDRYWTNRMQYHPEVDELVEAVRSFL